MSQAVMPPSGDRPPSRRENDAWHEYLETRLRRFFAKSLAAFAVIGLTSAFGLLGFGLSLKNQSQTSKEIQDQRYTSLVTSCTSQNERHDRAIQRADAILPLEQQGIVRLLVDELQPYVKNCDVYAKSRVKGT